MKKTVIIGGVAGGASCAARLRRLDADREIVLLERGKYISYANCGLPYHVGDVIRSRNALLLMTPERMRERFRVDVRTEHEVTALHREQKTVTVKNNYRLEVEQLGRCIAEGESPFVTKEFSLQCARTTDRILKAIGY